MLNQVRIVLVNTSHPGNIGSVARAMKTMGLANLYLVSPLEFPHAKATELASGASDVLEQAVIVSSLNEAIFDCTLVIGTSTRMRSIPWPLLTPCEMAHKIKQESNKGCVAILFGSEKFGLTNEELQRCHVHVQIPANPAYSSLNIAAAVQVIAYELYVASLNTEIIAKDWDFRPASADEMEKFFIHLQEVLVRVNFLKMDAPRRLMTRLRRLFLRAQPDVMEVNMLRGILTAVESSCHPERSEGSLDDTINPTLESQLTIGQ